MKILVTGSKGMLGQDVIKKFEKNTELIFTDHKTLDIINCKKVEEIVQKEKPNFIINCAAYTNVDKAEDEYELANKINCIGPQNLAKSAKEVDATLIHVSTDYVFDGNLNLDKKYNEQDIANPLSVYGKTKLEGEKGIIKYTDKYYIFRTAWLFGKNGKNFVTTILNLAKLKDKINVVLDQYGSPTYTKDLCNIIENSIEKQIPYGIYNATNLGGISRYEFAKKIVELSNINNCKIFPITAEKYIKTSIFKQAYRPKNSQLSVDKLLKRGIEIPTWEDAVARYLEEINYGTI